MPAKVYRIPATGRCSVSHHAVWENSPRVNGKLLLRPQPLTVYNHFVEKSFNNSSVGPWALPTGKTVDSGGNDGVLRLSNVANWAPIQNAAYAKFVGKVKGGSASLGVTLGSWRESSCMIADRYRKINDQFIVHADRYTRRKTQRKTRSPQTLAGDVLEWEFGWVPLAQDVHDALEVLVSPVLPKRVRARHSATEHTTVKWGDNASFLGTWHADEEASCTISAEMWISNPNLFLLNRLGLINPAAVAWDLVPWSFVVNFFSNAGTIIGSLTDFVGVELKDGNTTRTAVSQRLETYYAGINQNNYRGYVRSLQSYKEKVRTVGTPVPPAFHWKVPDFSVETLVIAASLVTQQLSRISKLARILT